MTHTNSIVSKLAVAVVAVAMAFAMVAPSAKAQDASAMSLEQLIALVNQLQSQLAGSSSTTTGSCSYIFTRSLTRGSTGADVMNLQKFLNMSADTQVAAAGVAGGPGMETSYFGPATAAAVSKFQVKYSADILVPSGLVSPTGFFGPASRAKANALCVASNSNGGTSTGGSNTGALKGGAGDLDISNKTSNIESEVTEGNTENVVAFEAEADDNSDIAVTSLRVVIDVNAASGASNRANRYIDEVLVMQDDKEVGSADISDFNRSGSTYTATITLKNVVVRAGDKARFYIALVARDSISSDDRANGNTTFDVAVDRIRYEDATGAILTDSPSNVKATGISFGSASDDNKLTVQNSSATPAATILKVDDSSTSDEYHVLTFRLKTGSKSGDIEITRLIVGVATSSGYSTTTPDNLLNDIWLKVGSKTLRDYTTTATSVIFDIDEDDLVIDGDDTEEVELYAKFNKQAGNTYQNGTVVKFTVASAGITAEDTKGNAVGLSGNATGKEMTLNTTAATVGSFKWNVSKNNNNNTGFISFRFTVEADDDDFTFSTSSLGATTSGTATTTGPSWAIVAGADNVATNGSNYTVASGEEATFEVTYNVTGPGSAAVNVTSVASQQVPSSSQYSGLEAF